MRLRWQSSRGGFGTGRLEREARRLLLSQCKLAIRVESEKRIAGGLKANCARGLNAVRLNAVNAVETVLNHFLSAAAFKFLAFLAIESGKL